MPGAFEQTVRQEQPVRVAAEALTQAQEVSKQTALGNNDAAQQAEIALKGVLDKNATLLRQNPAFNRSLLTALEQELLPARYIEREAATLTQWLTYDLERGDFENARINQAKLARHLEAHNNYIQQNRGRFRIPPAQFEGVAKQADALLTLYETSLALGKATAKGDAAEVTRFTTELRKLQSVNPGLCTPEKIQFSQQSAQLGQKQWNGAYRDALAINSNLTLFFSQPAAIYPLLSQRPSETGAAYEHRLHLLKKVYLSTFHRSLEGDIGYYLTGHSEERALALLKGPANWLEARLAQLKEARGVFGVDVESIIAAYDGLSREQRNTLTQQVNQYWKQKTGYPYTWALTPREIGANNQARIHAAMRAEEQKATAHELREALIFHPLKSTRLLQTTEIIQREYAAGRLPEVVRAYNGTSLTLLNQHLTQYLPPGARTESLRALLQGNPLRAAAFTLQAAIEEGNHDEIANLLSNKTQAQRTALEQEFLGINNNRSLAAALQAMPDQASAAESRRLLIAPTLTTLSPEELFHRAARNNSLLNPFRTTGAQMLSAVSNMTKEEAEAFKQSYTEKYGESPEVVATRVLGGGELRDVLDALQGAPATPTARLARGLNRLNDAQTGFSFLPRLFNRDLSPLMEGAEERLRRAPDFSAFDQAQAASDTFEQAKRRAATELASWGAMTVGFVLTPLTGGQSATAASLSIRFVQVLAGTAATKMLTNWAAQGTSYDSTKTPVLDFLTSVPDTAAAFTGARITGTLRSSALKLPPVPYSLGKEAAVGAFGGTLSGGGHSLIATLEHREEDPERTLQTTLRSFILSSLAGAGGSVAGRLMADTIQQQLERKIASEVARRTVGQNVTPLNAEHLSQQIATELTQTTKNLLRVHLASGAFGGAVGGAVGADLSEATDLTSAFRTLVYAILTGTSSGVVASLAGLPAYRRALTRNRGESAPGLNPAHQRLEESILTPLLTNTRVFLPHRIDLSRLYKIPGEITVTRKRNHTYTVSPPTDPFVLEYFSDRDGWQHVTNTTTLFPDTKLRVRKNTDTFGDDALRLTLPQLAEQSTRLAVELHQQEPGGNFVRNYVRFVVDQHGQWTLEPQEGSQAFFWDAKNRRRKRLTTATTLPPGTPFWLSRSGSFYKLPYAASHDAPMRDAAKKLLPPSQDPLQALKNTLIHKFEGFLFGQYFETPAAALENFFKDTRETSLSNLRKLQQNSDAPSPPTADEQSSSPLQIDGVPQIAWPTPAKPDDWVPREFLPSSPTFFFEAGAQALTQLKSNLTALRALEPGSEQHNQQQLKIFSQIIHYCHLMAHLNPMQSRQESHLVIADQANYLFHLAGYSSEVLTATEVATLLSHSSEGAQRSAQSWLTRAAERDQLINLWLEINSSLNEVARQTRPPRVQLDFSWTQNSLPHWERSLKIQESWKQSSSPLTIKPSMLQPGSNDDTPLLEIAPSIGSFQLKAHQHSVYTAQYFHRATLEWHDIGPASGGRVTTLYPTDAVRLIDKAGETRLLLKMPSLKGAHSRQTPEYFSRIFGPSENSTQTLLWPPPPFRGPATLSIQKATPSFYDVTNETQEPIYCIDPLTHQKVEVEPNSTTRLAAGTQIFIEDELALTLPYINSSFRRLTNFLAMRETGNQRYSALTLFDKLMHQNLVGDDSRELYLMTLQASHDQYNERPDWPAIRASQNREPPRPGQNQDEEQSFLSLSSPKDEEELFNQAFDRYRNSILSAENSFQQSKPPEPLTISGIPKRFLRTPYDDPFFTGSPARLEAYLARGVQILAKFQRLMILTPENHKAELKNLIGQYYHLMVNGEMTSVPDRDLVILTDQANYLLRLAGIDQQIEPALGVLFRRFNQNDAEKVWNSLVAPDAQSESGAPRN